MTEPRFAILTMLEYEVSSTHPFERDGLVKRTDLPPVSQQGQLSD